MNDETKVYPLPKGFDEEHFPKTAEYIRLHGIGSCMSEWDLKSPWKTCEEVYAECIKKEITWQKLLSFTTYDPNVYL